MEEAASWSRARPRKWRRAKSRSQDGFCNASSPAMPCWIARIRRVSRKAARAQKRTESWGSLILPRCAFRKFSMSTDFEITVGDVTDMEARVFVRYHGPAADE